MKRRRVFFAGSEVLGAHGLGLEPMVEACLGHKGSPSTVSMPYLGDTLTLPYRGFPASPGPVRSVLKRIGGAALDTARLGKERRHRAALLIGSSSLDANLHEEEYRAARADGPDAYPLRNPDQGFVANCLAADLAIDGPRHSFLTACSSGANALLYGAWLIRSGLVDDALVIGTEVFNRTSVLGFHGMLLISRSGICRPFDVDRDGIVLGECVAATVLSCNPVGARWKLLGGSTLCDTGQPTNSSPETIAEVIGQALDDAEVPATAVAAVKAHGTGTGSNDDSEARGILQAFPHGAPPMTALKPVIGHTLGACGVVETIGLMECLDRGALPAVANHQRPDPEILLAPVTENTFYAGGPVLLNYFGFGGNNCGLVVGPAGPRETPGA